MVKRSAQTKKIIDEVKRFKKISKKKFDVDKIIMFGSAAKGKMNENSDIDLILVSKKFSNKKFYERSIRLRRMWNLDYPVDLLCFSPEEFERGKKRISIISEAIREGVEI